MLGVFVLRMMHKKTKQKKERERERERVERDLTLIAFKRFDISP